MNIKSLNLHDLKPYLPMPEKEELHVWTIPAKSLDNLHKSQREYSHILLRKIISAYTNISEEDLEFTVGEHGKPALLNVSNLNFNLSHSGAYIVFIFSCTITNGTRYCFTHFLLLYLKLILLFLNFVFLL